MRRLNFRQLVGVVGKNKRGTLNLDPIKFPIKNAREETPDIDVRETSSLARGGTLQPRRGGFFSLFSGGFNSGLPPFSFLNSRIDRRFYSSRPLLELEVERRQRRLQREKNKEELERALFKLNLDLRPDNKAGIINIEIRPKATKNLTSVDKNGETFTASPKAMKNRIDFLELSEEERNIRIKDKNDELGNSPSKYSGAIFDGYEIPYSKTGLAPDFSSIPELLYNKDTNFGKVKMKLTGDRTQDFAKANKIMGLRETPEGFVWHHLDNLNANLEADMQLVRSDAHRATIKHIGSIGQQKKLLNQ